MRWADRDGAALDKALGELAVGARALALPLDITDEAAVAKAVARTEAELGGLDGVLNSAGIAADVPALDTKIDLFRAILDINVTGTFIVAQAAARIMQRRGGGAIVNMASVSGCAAARAAAPTAHPKVPSSHIDTSSCERISRDTASA